MIDLITDLLTLYLMLSSALLCGLYFIFSNTIMPALAQLADGKGLEAMQRINRLIQNAAFFLLFFGAPLSALTLLVLQANLTEIQLQWHGLLAAFLAIVAFVSTLLRNVPLNNRLDRLESDAPGSDQEWQHYLKHWVRWNNFRTLATLLSSVLLALPFSTV